MSRELPSPGSPEARRMYCTCSKYGVKTPVDATAHDEAALREWCDMLGQLPRRNMAQARTEAQP